MTREMKPCPFCGEHLIYQQRHGERFYGHENENKDCPMATFGIYDEKDLKLWNTRASDVQKTPCGHHSVRPSPFSDSVCEKCGVAI